VLFIVALVLAIFFLPSPWGIVAVLCGLALDLAEVGIGLWWNKRKKTTAVGVETLVGKSAVAVGELRPDGQVRVDGEIWRARCDMGCDAGSELVVTAVDGLTLEVAPVAGA
jgi:membrane protein implicated in regulation of membrane protease activity